MRTELFDYELPPELIAQEPVSPRDSSRLLVLGPEPDTSGAEPLGASAPMPDVSIEHRVFRDLPEYLEAGDLLILNRTRVLRARLLGRRRSTAGKVEVLLLRPAHSQTDHSQAERSGDGPDGTVWETLVRPGRRLQPGAEIVFGDALSTPRLTGRVIARTPAGGRLISFRPERAGESLDEILEALGRVPLPPYVTRPLDDDERYQTVYARVPGSAAAPTAGLHFTPELLDHLAAKGVETAWVTLHIGLDTFRPVREEEIEKHRMHHETYDLPAATAGAVEACRRRGGRVVACGTTVVRTLEAAADPRRPGLVVAGGGETSLFIYPGFEFRVVDLMITNFHLPRSTLLMLVSAFAGIDRIRAAYAEARRLKYRFYSFGDAMLIFRPAGWGRGEG